MMFEGWSFFSHGALALCLVACLACADAPGSRADHVDAALDPGLGAHTDAGLRRDADVPSRVADAATSSAALAACAAVGGAAPKTIADVVARINVLPQPASIACLVASLPRPLSLIATTSPSSAQPADGPDSPRVFIVSDTLTLSVVAGGHAEDLLEFGEFQGPLRSLKGELAFPLERPVADDAPYKRVLSPDRSTTSCRLCHSNETALDSIPNAFVSDALRVATYYELPLEDLRRVRAGCKQARNDEADARCDILRALLDYGEVRQGEFDPEIRQGF